MAPGRAAAGTGSSDKNAGRPQQSVILAKRDKATSKTFFVNPLGAEQTVMCAGSRRSCRQTTVLSRWSRHSTGTARRPSRRSATFLPPGAGRAAAGPAHRQRLHPQSAAASGLSSRLVPSTTAVPDLQRLGLRRPDMIYSLPFRVICCMNAAATFCRLSRSAPASKPRGLALAFCRSISAKSMTSATQTSSGGPDHAALIRAVAQHRDRAAFADLFAHFGPRVKAWMLRSGCNQTTADELAQEAMLVVWQKAHLFDPERAGASTWIFTVARNLRIDALRRERHPSDLMPDPSEEPDPPLPADRVLAVSQQEARIRTALKLLPLEQAEVIRKAFFEDKVHSEIEQELGIPLGTVKSRLRLAMVRLRMILGDLA